MQTNHCYIRPVLASDLDQMLVWRNQPHVRECMLTQHEISIEEHRQWFVRSTKDPTRCLMIVEEEAMALGFVGFSGVDEDAVSTWGFYTAPTAPKGSGTKLGLTALEFAFEVMRVHKVCGQALAFNAASIRFHQKFGFLQEGVLRKQHKINEQFHDLICFGLLREEWNIKSRQQA